MDSVQCWYPGPPRLTSLFNGVILFDLKFAVQTEHPTLHNDDAPNARQGCVVDEDVSLSIAGRKMVDEDTYRHGKYRRWNVTLFQYHKSTLPVSSLRATVPAISVNDSTSASLHRIEPI